MKLPSSRLVLAAALAFSLISPLSAPVGAAVSLPTAQSTPQSAGANPAPAKPAPTPALPKDYAIGVEDLLSVVFWNAKELSTDVVVRPDGKISVPLLNDVPAVGMTPEELALAIAKAAAKFVKDPGATVIVREIRSRKVFLVGEVAKPGALALGSEMTVLQAIAEAGGFSEVAKRGDVVIVRNENGKERRFKFNYNEVVKGKNVQQNIRLLPGDIIIIR